jgi:hypothetical protein
MIYQDQAFTHPIIWLLPNHLPHSPVSKLDWRVATQGRLGKGDNLLTGEGERGGVGKEPNHTTAKKHDSL